MSRLWYKKPKIKTRKIKLNLFLRAPSFGGSNLGSPQINKNNFDSPLLALLVYS